MTTVRSLCSIPQSGWTLGESKCLTCQTGCSSGNGRSLYSFSGNTLLHEGLEPLAELRVTAAGIGKEKTPLLDVFAQVPPGFR